MTEALCRRHVYADPPEQFPLSSCPACVEEAEAEYEIAMDGERSAG